MAVGYNPYDPNNPDYPYGTVSGNSDPNAGEGPGGTPWGMPGTPGNPNTGTSPPDGTQPTTPGGTLGTPYSESALQAILRKYPPTKEGLQQGLAEANKTFGTMISAIASTGGEKIRLPDGRLIDTITDAGGPGAAWSWQDITSGGSGGGNGVGMALDPSLLAPWTGNAPTPGTPNFQSPGAFQAPTAQDLYADPSYQFRLDQGRGAIENSAAAKGVLNSGGTLADILNYGQKAGSQEYSNVWDRKFGTWNANWNNALTSFRAASDSNNSNYTRAWNAYTDARDSFYRNQDGPFSKLFSVAQLGANAAGA